MNDGMEAIAFSEQPRGFDEWLPLHRSLAKKCKS